MRLPVELKRTMHKHGGRIERIYSIGHECAKPRDGRSQDIWYFIGDVVWRDGSASREIEIAAYSICAEEDKEPEIRELLALLNDYLHDNGEWCDSKSKHEGWYANVRPEAKVRRRA